jgi:hypothetical protein
MTATTSLSVFHQWLLADPASMTSACAIVLHGAGTSTSGRLIQEVAEYLNEYDDDGDGRWLPATPELVEKVCLDPNHRTLLGMSAALPGQSGDLRHEIRTTLFALAERGHVVLKAPDSSDREFDAAATFHVGIGKSPDLLKKCHMILNPDLMDQNVIAHTIGDVFLEWLHCEIRRHAPIQDIR